MEKTIKFKHQVLRSVALATAVFFFHSQIFVFAQLPDQQSAQPLNSLYEKSADAPARESEVSSAAQNLNLSTDFLQGESPVPKTRVIEEEKEEEKASAPEQEEVSSEKTPFEKALDLVNQAKGFAVSVVEKITGSDLAKLAAQAWEYGVAVVKGITLLFTSHEENRLSVTSTFRRLLDQAADFLLHKQPAGDILPSQTDLNGAAARGGEEYVLSLDSSAAVRVLRYDGEGVNGETGLENVVREISRYEDLSKSSLREIEDLIKSENTEDYRLLEFYRSDPPVEIDPDASNPAVTPVPLTHTGTEPALTPKASTVNPGNGAPDYSSVDLSQASKTDGSLLFKLFNPNSWGWAELDYDDPFTSGATEFFNFSSVFSSGLALELSSPDLTQVILELTDVNGLKSRVILRGITSTAKRWKILGSQLPGIDLTKIRKVSLGLEGRSVNTHLDFKWGNFSYAPKVQPDASNPAITQVPLNSSGEAPELNGAATSVNPSTGAPDFSSVEVSQTSSSEGTALFKLFNGNSSGWALLDYDDSDTAGTVESISFNSVFSSGLTLELSSPDLTQAVMEFTDAAGQKARVLLQGITNSAKRWKIQASQLPGIDLTKIRKIGLGVEGQSINTHLNFKWGKFYYVPDLAADPSNPPVTPISENSLGDRPVLNGFASAATPSGGIDYSSTDVAVSSTSSALLTLKHFNDSSFGGAYLSYDNPATTSTLETVSFTSAFPSGLVLGLSSADGVQDAYFAIQDNLGRTAGVHLTGITNSEQRYKMDLSLFENIDLTKIVNIVLNVEGRYVDKHLNVSWGNFFYIPPVSNDPSNPAITPLPVTSSGNKPVFKASASTVNPNTGGVDYSQTVTTLKSESSAVIRFRQFNDSSWGQSAVLYDDPGTGTVEYVNLNAAFPSGMAFTLSDNGTGLSEVFLEVIDADGNRDRVRLTGISAAAKTYKLSPSLFDEVDLTRIVSLAFREEGRYVDKTLTVDWGQFAYATEISGTAYHEGSLTVLNGQPGLSVQTGNLNASQAAAAADLDQKSDSEFSFVFDRRASESSFAGVSISGGLLNLPQDFVVAVRGAEGGKVRVVLTDASGNQAVFILNLRPVYQNYTLSLSGVRVPAGFDRTKIASVAFEEDGKIGAPLAEDLIKVRIPGLDYDAPVYPAAYTSAKEMLITKGLTYFTTGKGIDPVTHFPYDGIEANGIPAASSKFTQPTLIGFYLQILADVASGTLDNGMTPDQAIAEMNTVVTNLLSAQSSFGWNGLLPWMKLSPSLAPITNNIALGDNANLAQSIAVAVGTLQTASLNAAQTLAAQAVMDKAENFLDNQQPGYEAFVDPVSESFFQVFERSSPTSASGSFPLYFMDRLANEFRAPVAFIVARYPTIPDSVWESLQRKYRSYTDRNGQQIENLAYFDGGAFQAFWPLLRFQEDDFIGFRKALNNAFVSFTDYSAQQGIPGFVSASQRPNGTSSGSYEGRTGVRQIAEAGLTDADQFITDVGSTYALASAFSLDPETVLKWLAAIREQLPALESNEGFYDAARSNSEIAKRTLGIDAGSMIIGLADSGPKAFEAYMRNAGIELHYNLLYDSMSRQLNITDQTSTQAAAPPEFADKSLAVFSHIQFEGRINGFQGPVAGGSGVHLINGNLPDGYGGYYWVLDQVYPAQANQLVITYSAVNTPGAVKIELKDANDQLVIPAFTPVLENTLTDKQIVITLPNNGTVNTIQRVFLIVDQNATGDTSNDFIIHSINFEHKPSFQALLPDPSLGAGDVTNLPGSPSTVFFSSTGQGSIESPSADVRRLNYNIPGEGFTGFSINFDPANSGASQDLSGFPKIVFGLNASNVDKVKIEIEDASGKRAILYATGVDVARGYYQFLTNSLAGSVDMTHIKKINFLVDNLLISENPASGNFEVEIKGLA